MRLFKKFFLAGIAKVFTLPRLSLPLITSLGLTLGAVLSVIAIVSALMLKPLEGIRDEDNLYTLSLDFQFNEQMYISYWDFTRLANFNQAFNELGQWAGINATQSKININDINLAVTSFNASDNILDVLGTKLIKGRALNVEDPSKLIWISNSLWQQQFAGLSSAIDSPIDINGQTYVVAGVIEDLMSVDSHEPILTEQIWFIENLTQYLDKAETTNIASVLPHLLFRANQANTQIPSKDTIKQWQRDFIQNKAPSEAIQPFMDFLNNLEARIESKSYRDSILGDTSELIVILLIAVVGLLVMACLNLLNLFIAHYQGRTKEFGVQLSMGATQNKLRSLIFIENLPSMMIATITGILAAGWIIKMLPVISGNNLPMVDQISLDIYVVLAAIAIILVLNVLFSSLSLVDINKKSLMENLNSSGKGTKGQANEAISKGLMILQLAIASVLLTAATMLAFKSYHLVYQDLGYEINDTRHISMRIDDEQWVEQLADFDNYYTSEIKSVEEEITALLSQELPDSEFVIATDGPLTYRMSFSVTTHPDDPEQQVMLSYKRTMPGFFDKFGIDLLAGSNITQAMIESQEQIVVIDEIAAQVFFPELSIQETIGKELKLGNERSYKVVGVAPTIKTTAGHQMDKKTPIIYRPYESFRQLLSFTFKMPDDIAIDDMALQQKIQQRFPRITEIKSETLNELWSTQTLRQRTSLYMVIAMALLTTVLAIIGVGGLTQMTTNHRKHELAIRMATGASQARLLKLLFVHASWLTALGLGFGFILSVFSYDYIQAYMTALPPFKWSAIISLNISLVAVVSLAILWPAWQIIRRDPMQTLRDE
ncbi:ABC transporter permease [Thalassotalea ganghwensis]